MVNHRLLLATFCGLLGLQACSSPLYFRSDEAESATIPTNTTQSLNDVSAYAENDVWMVGDVGTILHYDGARVTKIGANIGADIESVHAIGPNRAIVAGPDSYLAEIDGERFVSRTLPDLRSSSTSKNVFSSLSGLGQEVWLLESAKTWKLQGSNEQEHPVMLHWDGAAWSAVFFPDESTPIRGLAVALNRGRAMVFGNGNGKVFLCDASACLHVSTLVGLSSPFFRDSCVGPTGLPWIVGSQDPSTRAFALEWSEDPPIEIDAFLESDADLFAVSCLSDGAVMAAGSGSSIFVRKDSVWETAAFNRYSNAFRAMSVTAEAAYVVGSNGFFARIRRP